MAVREYSPDNYINQDMGPALRPSPTLGPSINSGSICQLGGHLPTQGPSINSGAICQLRGHLSAQGPSVNLGAIYQLGGHLSTRGPFINSVAIFQLGGHLSTWGPSLHLGGHLPLRPRLSGDTATTNSSSYNCQIIVFFACVECQHN